MCFTGKFPSKNQKIEKKPISVVICLNCKLLSFFNYDIFKSEKSLTFNSINQFKKYISYIKVNKNMKLKFGYTGLKLGFFSSHFYIFIKKQK